VTGASGFIGSAVVRRLIAAGRPVRCFVRSTSRTDRLDDLPCERAIGDLREAGAVERAARGCQAVIHLGGISAWSDINSPLMFPVVVEGTRHVLAAAKEHALPVVYASSAAALGPSRIPRPRDETAAFDGRAAAGMTYVLAKREAEQLCLAAAADGLPVVIASPAEVYGPRDRDLITAGNLIGLLKGPVALVCRGGTSIVHVEDVAQGMMQALDRGASGRRYLLGGDNLHHRELAQLLLELSGRRRPVVTLPAGLVRISAALAARCRMPFPIPPPVVPYATSFWFVDHSRAKVELGIEFRSARETLAETLAWLRAAGYLR